MKGEKLNNSKKKLLMVEDDKITVDIVRVFVQKKYELDHAFTGEEALVKAAKYDYDCFLMDIGLPGKMNGMDTAKKLKEIKGYKNKPFIAVTAYAMKGDKEFFLSQGMTHYIMKPFKRHEVLELITEALKS